MCALLLLLFFILYLAVGFPGACLLFLLFLIVLP